jgi:hypothetical protein
MEGVWQTANSLAMSALGYSQCGTQQLSVVRSFGAADGLDYWSIGLVLGLMLSDVVAVLQASMFDGLSLDPFSSMDDGRGSAEVSISGRYVFQALVVYCRAW